MRLHLNAIFNRKRGEEKLHFLSLCGGNEKINEEWWLLIDNKEAGMDFFSAQQICSTKNVKKLNKILIICIIRSRRGQEFVGSFVRLQGFLRVDING